MPRTRTGKVTTRNSSSLSTTHIDSYSELFESTHVMLRELSTQELVIIEIKLLSRATQTKSLVIGQNISFRHGTGRGQQRGEVILVGTYNEIVIEMNNRTSTSDLTESSENLQRQDDSLEQNHIDKCASVSNSSILLNTVEPTLAQSPSPIQSSISKNSTIPLPSVTSSTTVTTATVNSDSLSSICSTTAINKISMRNNIVKTAQSITTQRSPSLSSESSTLIAIPSTSKNPTASRSLVPSTTIKRKMASGEALKELKHLQSLVKLKDDEISKLNEQNEKLKQEIEKISKHSILIPTDDGVLQWVDYLYESVHKDELREQIDLDATAHELGIDRESMDLCLELFGTDRISTARQLFKHCTNYDEDIRKEHCWQNADEAVVVKICRFVRVFFGTSLKYDDGYVRESLSNMMRKDSWVVRNPDKVKTKSQRSRSTFTEVLPKPVEEIHDENDHDMNGDDDTHF